MALYYHVDVCSGSGMLGLAAKIALDGQLRTVAYVEREACAAATLVARMEDKTLDKAPIWDDVCTMHEQEFSEYVLQFRPLIVTAGYPCQPFSQIGKRLGQNDPRHIWPQINAFISKVKPECVFLENVPGHLRMGFGSVWRDLRRNGYRVTAGIFSAEEVGASHCRDRLFILATRQENCESVGFCEALADTACNDWIDADKSKIDIKVKEFGKTAKSSEEFCIPLFAPRPNNTEAWRELLKIRPGLEPTVRRVDHGMANWMVEDQLRLAGNGVVTLAACYAFISLVAALTYKG